MNMVNITNGYIPTPSCGPGMIFIQDGSTEYCGKLHVLGGPSSGFFKFLKDREAFLFTGVKKLKVCEK